MVTLATSARAAAILGILSIFGTLLPAQVSGGVGSPAPKDPTPAQDPVKNSDTGSQLKIKKTGQDGKFLKAALERGLGEVQLGQLALEKGNSESVRQFGSQMVDDHTKMDAELRRIAQRLGISVPARMTRKDRKALVKLSKLSGPAFDHAYISSMVQDHTDHLRVFQVEAASGQDALAKDQAVRGSKTINDQLQVAQQMAMNRKIDLAGR
jgi:putative membrane protein